MAMEKKLFCPTVRDFGILYGCNLAEVRQYMFPSDLLSVLINYTEPYLTFLASYFTKVHKFVC